MRFTVRDFCWLITGVAIAFAILGSIWRREYATWNLERVRLHHERAAMQADVEQQKSRAALAERNWKGIQQDLQEPVVIRELALAADAELRMRAQSTRPATSSPSPIRGPKPQD